MAPKVRRLLEDIMLVIGKRVPSFCWRVIGESDRKSEHCMLICSVSNSMPTIKSMMSGQIHLGW
jgi:hypothetical protein